MASFPTVPGFPDSSNTGVPAGVTLMPSGSITISTPGAVVSGLDIHGTVYIDASNVTLQDCQITSNSYAVVKVKSGLTGVVIQNNEINGVGSGNDGSHGIMGSGTFLNNEIYNVENGITLTGGDTVIKDNYIHNLKASGAPHYDGIQIDGGISNVLIQHNTVINDYGQTSAVMIDNWFGPISNIKVDGNYLAGGGYTVYSDGQFSGGSISGVSFTNNYMGEGQYCYESSPNNNPVWTGNIDLASNHYVSSTGILSGIAPGYTPPPDTTPPPPDSPPPPPPPEESNLTHTDGPDTLIGTSGNDILNGWGGADTLYGKGGNDVFQFSSKFSADGDKVMDFVRGADKLDFSKIDASTWGSGDQAFTFDGYASGGRNGHLWAVDDPGAGVTHVYGKAGDFQFHVDLQGAHLGLTGADFIL